MLLQTLPVSDTNYWVLPYIACATKPSVLSEYGLHGRSAVWRRGSFLDPAIFDYVDALCMNRKYDPLMRNLHEIMLGVRIGTFGQIYVDADELNEERLRNLGITAKTITLRDIFTDPEAKLLIEDIEESVRKSPKLLMRAGPFTMHFRTLEERSIDFHIDVPNDVYGLSYGPSCTELGPIDSFTKLPAVFDDKKFWHIAGAPLYKLERGDASILKVPHRAGALEAPEEIEKYEKKDYGSAFTGKCLEDISFTNFTEFEIQMSSMHTYELNPSSPIFSAQPEILGEFRTRQRSVVYERVLPTELSGFVDNLLHDPENRAYVEKLHTMCWRAYVDGREIDLFLLRTSNDRDSFFGPAGSRINLHYMFQKFKGEGSDGLADDMYAQIAETAAMAGQREINIELITLQERISTVTPHNHNFPVRSILYGGNGPCLIPDEARLYDRKTYQNFAIPALVTKIEKPSVTVIHPGEWHASPEPEFLEPQYQGDETQPRLRLYAFMYGVHKGNYTNYEP